jgi:paraquat-inducible protein A
MRCGETLKRLHHGDPSHLLWALTSAGLILWVLANVYPILTFDVAGNTQSNLIITGVLGLMQQGFWPVAILVFFCSIAAPVIHLGTLWYVAGACALGIRLPMVHRAAHLAKEIAPWSLVPVFMIACFVAVVKLDMLGTVSWDTGIFWVSLLSICSLAIAQFIDHKWIAHRLEELA